MPERAMSPPGRNCGANDGAGRSPRAAPLKTPLAAHTGSVRCRSLAQVTAGATFGRRPDFPTGNGGCPQYAPAHPGFQRFWTDGRPTGRASDPWAPELSGRVEREGHADLRP